MTVRGLFWSAFGCLPLLVLAVPAHAGGLNQKVLDFSKQHVGQQVGDGDCFTFAAAALKAAGARLNFKQAPGPGDAVWGSLVYTMEVRDGARVVRAAKGRRVQPGDVMQFRDTTFAGKNYSLIATQHSAIVIAVGAGGKALTVLHQNWKGKQTVQQTRFLLNDLKSGWVRIYRPLAP